jgi:hypothetical protein
MWVETTYMVTSGQHYNGGCCFDYGNAEIGPPSGHGYGRGNVEAIYWGCGDVCLFCAILDCKPNICQDRLGTNMEKLKKTKTQFCRNSSAHHWSRGSGAGPWMMAELEMGLWAGGAKSVPENTPISWQTSSPPCSKGGPGLWKVGMLILARG